MRKALLLFAIVFIGIALLPQVAFPVEDEPRYAHILFGPDGRLIFDSMPKVYFSLYTSLSKSSLVKLEDPGETRKILSKANVVKVFPGKMRMLLEKLVKEHDLKNILAQSVEGRYDQGGVYTWLIEDGKWQIKGKWNRVNEKEKPALGAVDTMLAMSMLIFETEKSPVARVMELEKYGTLQSISEGYRVLESKGVRFARGYYLDSMREAINGKWIKAGKSALLAVELDPFWPPNYMALSQAANETGDEKLLVKKVEAGLKTYPDNLGLIMILVSRLDLMVDELRISKLLEKARSIDSENPGLIELEMKFALEQKDFSSVSVLVKRYFESENTTSKGRLTFGLTIAQKLYDLRHYSKAASVYQIVLENSPQASIFLEKARCHEKLGDLEGKLQAELSAFSIMPDQELSWSIIDGARDTREIESTIATLIETGENNPADPIPRFTTGILYTLKGELQSAMELFNKAEKLSDERRQVRFYRLVAVAALGEMETQFREEFAGYANDFGEHPDTKALGAMLARLLKFERAEFFLKTELDKGSPDFDALFDLGLCYAHMNDYKMFKKVVKSVRKMEHKEPAKWGLILSVWYGHKKKEKFLEELLEVVKQVRERKTQGKEGACYRFDLIKNNTMEKLSEDHKIVVKAYFDFLDDRITSGALAFKLTSMK